jgi:hypothetical protein
LVFTHFVPFADIVLNLELACGRRVAAFLSKGITDQKGQQEKSEHIRKIIIMIFQQIKMNIQPDTSMFKGLIDYH